MFTKLKSHDKNDNEDKNNLGIEFTLEQWPTHFDKAHNACHSGSPNNQHSQTECNSGLQYKWQNYKAQRIQIKTGRGLSSHRVSHELLASERQGLFHGRHPGHESSRKTSPIWYQVQSPHCLPLILDLLKR